MNAKRPLIELLTVTGLVMALVSGTSLAWAQFSPSAGIQQISGKILLVDPANRLLRLQTEKKPGILSTTESMEFVLSANTVITQGAQKLQPADLKTGTDVQIEYKIEGSRQIAQSIAVQKSTETSAPMKPEGAQPAP